MALRGSLPPLVAFGQLQARMAAQLEELSRLTMAAASGPTARRAAIGRATAQARDDLAGADARQELLQRRVDPRGPDAFKGQALKAVTQELTEQERTLARIRASQDPTILREQVRLQQQITRAEKERELARLRVGLDPRGLREQVRLDREIAQARRQAGQAQAQEEGRQDPLGTLGGALGPLLARVPGLGGIAGGVGRAASAATGPQAAGIAGALSGLGAMAGPLGAIIAAAPAAIDALGSVKDAVVSLGGKASPGALIRWNLALDDTQAVIGRALVPVLELFTSGLRLVGDTLITILPRTNEVRQALEPLEQALRELRPQIAQLAPLVRELARAGLADIARQMAGLIKVVVPLAKVTMLLSGLNVMASPGSGKLDSSTGAAPRQPQFLDIQTYLRQSYEQALLQSTPGGGGAIQDPATRTADSAAKTAETLQSVLDVLRFIAGRMPTGAKEGAGLVLDWVESSTGRAITGGIGR